MGLVKTVFISEDLVQELQDNRSQSHHFKAPTGIGKHAMLIKMLHQKNAKLKRTYDSLMRQKRYRIKPRPALKHLMKLKNILRFQRIQVKSLAVKSHKKEEMIRDLQKKISRAEEMYKRYI